MLSYMKVEGMTGTGTGKYFGWIVLERFTTSSSHPNEITTTKRADNVSAMLYRFFTQDSDLKKVIIHFVKGDAKNPVPYFIWELEGAWLSYWGFSEPGDDGPVENLTIGFATATEKSPGDAKRG